MKAPMMTIKGDVWDGDCVKESALANIRYMYRIICEFVKCVIENFTMC